MSDLPLSSAAENQISRLGERVARLEAQQDSLKDDTRVSRSTLHETNNRMQEFVAVVVRLTATVDGLVREQSKTQVEMSGLAATQRGLAEAVGDFIRMKSNLVGVIEAQQREIGRWTLVAKAGTILVGVLTVAGILVSFWQYWRI